MRRYSRELRGSAALGLAGLMGLVVPSLGATPPRSATIVIDGGLDDWALVLANPSNTSRDGEGSSGGCVVSSDRDCPIPSAVNDVVRFAWTWDATNYYAYFERAGSRGGTELGWIYFDVNGSGLLELGAPIIQVNFDTGALTLLRYAPLASGGDPTADGAGFADGHSMEGRSAVMTVDLGSTITADPLRTELAVSWANLAIAPGAAYGYHVGLGDGPCDGTNARDNMGGSDGRPGSSAWRALRFAPGASQAAAPVGGMASLVHVLVNDGNVVTTPLVDLAATCRAAVELWRDDDADGVGDVRLCRDAEGDGDLRGPDDALDAAGDADGDGRLDVGSLAPQAAVALVVVVQPRPNCGTVRVDLMATDGGDATSRANVADVVRVGAVTLEPDVSVLAVAGDDALCAHVLRNNLASALRIDLSVLSSFSWAWSLVEDADGNGDPAGDPAIVDTDGSGAPDVAVSGGGFVNILASARVPPGAPVGFVEDAVIQAKQGGSWLASVADRVTVRRAVDLGPNYLRVEGHEHRGPSGGSVWFAHRLVNAVSTAETFDLSASSPEGWPVSFFADPDRDGRPYDAEPMPPSTPAVAGNGGTFDFLVRVDLPSSESPPAGTIASVVATSPTRPSAMDAAYDEAVAAIVTTWEDPAHASSLVEAAPCSRVHALATGVPSTSDVRFEWRDAGGALRRAVRVTSDSQGRASDAYGLGMGDVGTDLSVEVQAADGTPLDRTTFDVVEPLVVQSLATERAAYGPASTVHASLDVVNESFLVEPRDVRVHAVVLSLDVRWYLDAGGAFQPWSGVEWTATRDVPVVRREERMGLAFSLPAQFPAEGTYLLQAWLEPSCGPSRLAASTTFEVSADGDGDGLLDAEEMAAGTSPSDADSDDDGVLDGDDGVVDTDADGAVDALDCDSDGDRLLDGLESGATAPAPDTDVSRGCFVPDADPSSTSDPHAADSDGGGLPDGAEDRNRDGARDAGDKDPLDPTDDADGCAGTAPPEIPDLRVSRMGGSAVLAWPASSDACVGYDVLVSEGLPGWRVVADLTWTASHRDDEPLAPATLRFYDVRPRSALDVP